ncbi:hypothetical protein B0H17DRAFT_1192351 [Mycena rosella]|uniref:Uncharacterized protein n=1 Tax=Mycena rosella TaxID=1033263 RepID=A0AAD7M9P2_MYCRO|nr:hypothetical protein B0H17DRAFT_1192351 [Mycena rosella]
MVDSIVSVNNLRYSGFIFSLIKIPRLKLLRVLELTFATYLPTYIGIFRDLPSNLSPVVLDFPNSVPLLERLTLTFGIMSRIPEIPWSLDPPYPVFDTGFMERRDLPRLHNMTCCLYFTMDYFHGDQKVSYDGFIAAIYQDHLPALDLLAVIGISHFRFHSLFVM